MIVSRETISKLPEKEQKLILALLSDLEEINSYNPNKSLYLEWQDWHNEYSPERVDPCPDYYGYYILKNTENNDLIGVEMTAEDLDISLCLLYNYMFDV